MVVLKVFLLRHAHREVLDREEDNGISEKGHRQSQELSTYFQSYLEHEFSSCLLFSSPKKRCQETLQALSRSIKLPITINEDLDERRPDEDSKTFDTRIKVLLNKWSLDHANKTIIACSHGDWIPEALYLFCSTRTQIRKAGWAELHFSDETSWTIQDLVESSSQKFQ